MVRNKREFMDAMSNPIFWGSAVIILWVIPWAIFGSSVVVGDQRYFYLADDPTISLRYGRNLAEGLGLVWNAGERVEGYSNFLWTIYMAGLHLLPITTPYIGLAVILTNVAISVVGLVLVYKLAKKIVPAREFAVIAVAAYALNGDIFEWMLRGFETTLMATLLLLAFFRLIEDSEDGSPRLGTYLLIGCLTLVRTDGLILAGPLFLFGILTARNFKKAVGWTAIAMAIPVAHLGFRWAYYGDLLPNTAYLKLYGFPGRVLSGVKWTLKFLLSYPFATLFVVLALCRARDWPVRAGATLCLLFCAYTIYIGGDSFSGFRFLAPVIPLFLLVAFGTAWRATGTVNAIHWERIRSALNAKSWIAPVGLVAGSLIFVAAIGAWPAHGQDRILRQSILSFFGSIGFGVAVLAFCALLQRSSSQSQIKILREIAPMRLAVMGLLLTNTPLLFWSHAHPAPWGPAYPDNVRMGLFIKEHTPVDASIGDSWAGITAYFSERRGIDFLGKCEPHVARMSAVSDGTVPGHNKFDFDYSIGRLRPDYVIASFKLPVSAAEMEADSHGDYAFIGKLYFNEVFRRQCLPHPLQTPSELRRSIFKCDWPATRG